MDCCTTYIYALNPKIASVFLACVFLVLKLLNFWSRVRGHSIQHNYMMFSDQMASVISFLFPADVLHQLVHVDLTQPPQLRLKDCFLLFILSEHFKALQQKFCVKNNEQEQNIADAANQGKYIVTELTEA